MNTISLECEPTSDRRTEPREVPPARQPISGDAPGPKANRKLWSAVGAAVVLAAAGLAAVGIIPRLSAQQTLAADAHAAATTARQVIVISPRPAPLSSEIILPGSTHPLQETTVFARTSGYLRRTLVDIGERVEAGQLLAEIESPEVDQQLREADARLAEARANLELARTQLNRFVSLKDLHAASQQTVDDQQARVNTAQAAMQVFEATVARLATDQAYEKVVAPFAGVITTRNVDKGSLITAGSGSVVTSLYTIAQTDTLRVFVNVPQTDFAAIAANQQAQVLVAEFPGERFIGTVARTAGVLDEASRTLRTEVHLPNPQGKLTAGLYVQVKFNIVRKQPVLLVPSPALVTRADGPRLAVVGADSAIHYVPITLGRDFGREVEVMTGLTGNERLVATPSDDLKEGQSVRTTSAEQP